MKGAHIWEVVKLLIGMFFTYVIGYGLGILVAIVLSPIIIFFALIKAILDI